jgi:hypothetical protein
MSHDVAFYRGLGLEEVETVQWLLPASAVNAPEVANPGFALLPRLLWNRHQGVSRFVRGFARDFYGTDRASDLLSLVAAADRANPRYVCTPDRGDGPSRAAGLLKQALARCVDVEESVSGHYRERLAGLARVLRYDLARAEAGEA